MNHPDWLAQILAALPDGIKTPLETQQTEVLIALLVLLVTIAVIVLSRLVAPKKASGSSVLIAGPCNAGKTMLFMQLRDGTTHNGTVASMQENSGVVSVNNDRGQTVGSVSVVDVPGHERLRRILEKRLDDASAVVFVIDAADITPHKVEAAEELFEVLTHPGISKRRVPILIACNKMDLDAQAHSVEFVKRTLEKQLDAMRRTRTTLSPEAAARAAVLGKPSSGPAGASGAGSGFSLSSLRNPISTASVSALSGDVAEVHAFLSRFAR